MVIRRTRRKIQAVLTLLLLTVVAYASVTGPEARYTGAPGDINSCVQCHDSFQLNEGPGSVRIEDAPAVYEPGRTYTLRVIVQQSGRQRYGFQLTAMNGQGSRAGTLSPKAGDSEINGQTGMGGRQYIQHTQAGTLPNGQNSRTWQVDWTAPNPDAGAVSFYAAGNAANGNGTNQGDYIYTTKAISESASSAVTATLATRPDDLTLEAGTNYLITWSATNPSNVDNYELRYSTDDGMTFPITNLITSIQDANVTSFEWTVPNTPTTQARLRLTVSPKSGSPPITIITGRFTVSGDGITPGPRITAVSVSGKKLFVEGENFQMGAKVILNGESQKTSNEDDFSHQLMCKKAGKKAKSGVTVSLIVRNPDGSQSESFTFTKP